MVEVFWEHGKKVPTTLLVANDSPFCFPLSFSFSYVCQDMVKEFRRYDTDPYKYFERFEGEHTVTGRVSFLKILNLLFIHHSSASRFGGFS